MPHTVPNHLCDTDYFHLWDLPSDELGKLLRELPEYIDEVDPYILDTLFEVAISRDLITFDVRRMAPETLAAFRDYLMRTRRLGMYLSQPYAKQVADGTQTAVLKSQEYNLMYGFNILVTKDKAYGYIRFYNPELLSKEQVADRAYAHLVAPEQIEKWWPGKEEFFYYEVRDFIPFDAPMDTGPLEGSGVFVEKVELRQEDEVAKSTGRERRVRLKGKVLKQIDEEHTILGEVLIPNYVDYQGDIVSEEEIRKAAHAFMLDCQQIGIQHIEENPALQLVESYVAPVDMEIDGTLVTKGTWLIKTKVFDEAVWQQVKDGTFTGYSIEAYAVYGDPEEVKVEEVA